MSGYPTPASDYPGDEQLRQAIPDQVTVRLPSATAVITYILMAISVLVYLVQMWSSSQLGFDLPAALGVKANELIIEGQYWRLITPMFLHGSIMHLGFNMYALYIFGPGLERYYGHWRYLALYFLAGFAGNVVSFLFSDAPSLGSSTAIFGLLGAEGVFLYQNRGFFGRASQRALGNLVLIAVVNLVIGLSPGIDNWGHIGGLIGGTLFAWFAGPVLYVGGEYPALRAADRRDWRTALWVAIGVGGVFVALALLAIFLRS